MSATPPLEDSSLRLQVLDQAYKRGAWHGPNLRQSLRGVSAKTAAWRPAPARHNIWEIAVHAAYWKYAVRRRLRGEKRGSFALKGSNWFKRPAELSEKAWRADLRMLKAEHRACARRLWITGRARPVRSLIGRSSEWRFTTAIMPDKFAYCAGCGAGSQPVRVESRGVTGK